MQPSLQQKSGQDLQRQQVPSQPRVPAVLHQDEDLHGVLGEGGEQPAEQLCHLQLWEVDRGHGGSEVLQVPEHGGGDRGLPGPHPGGLLARRQHHHHGTEAENIFLGVICYL